ncbi:MAG: gliding motility-associated C-terminal domain-containing protein, partial [Bacteroidota bacterium]
MIRTALLCILMLLTSVSHNLWATHLRAGEITVSRVDCSGLTFRITITVYTDTGSEVRFGEGFLDFGDGSAPFALPIIENNLRATVLSDGSIITEPINADDLGEQVAVASLTIEHTYSSVGRFNIGYIEPNRNEGVLNIDNSVNTTFFVETQIDIDPFLGCNNTPILLIPPIDRGCTSAAFFHNPGAFDPDGDSIAFELVVPKKELGVVVDGYEPLNDRNFYENFEQGNEDRDGEPTFFIDPITGEIEWDAPGRIGEYNIAFIVKEYRKIGGEFFLLGFVTRDMQIIVEDCDNERPELIIPEDICVEAGTIIDETIFGIDPDNDQVKIEAFSQVFDFGATITPTDPQFVPSSPPAELQFRWETECIDVRDQPYQVVFKITDNPPMGPSLVAFETWNITVVGPSPVITEVEQDGQALRVNWDEYTCQNAELIQVWRRVDENPYMPEECETGIRENAGYTLIEELPVTATTFRDTEVVAAAKYCYRLAAIFPQPAGGESVVSEEVCFEFVPAEEPVITHVSVTRTDRTNGEIEVAWREPFELGTLTLPYNYVIERATGLTGNDFVEVGRQTDPDGLMDSIGFVDSNINTEDNAFSYRIGIIDPSGSDPNEVIYSAAASSVRLTPTPRFGEIELNWTANVPWSNTIATPPDSEHLIFRGFEGDSEEELELI